MNKILTFNGKIATGGGRWITRAGSTPSPYNPYNLAPRTVRFQLPRGYPLPSLEYGQTWTPVDPENGIWDLYSSGNAITMTHFHAGTVILGGNFDSPGFTVHTTYTGFLSSIQSLYLGNHDANDTEWRDVFQDINIESVCNVDFGNITDIHALFSGNTHILHIDSFNIPSVTNMSELCNGCYRIDCVPEFFGINGQVVNCQAAFYDCHSAEYGITQLYEQLTAVQEPSEHLYCFRNCGVNSPTGSAELAQIPSDWK